MKYLFSRLLMSAAEARQRLRILEPKPWPSDRAAALGAIQALKLPPGFAGDMAVLWLCDGLAGADRGAAGRLADRLADIEKRAHIGARRAQTAVRVYARENPWTTLSIGAAAGMLLGAILVPKAGRRRS